MSARDALERAVRDGRVAEVLSEFDAMEAHHERLKTRWAQASAEASRLRQQREDDAATVHRANDALSLAVADNAELLEDARAALGYFHGHLCEMAGGPYPESPAECADPVCLRRSAAVAADHPGAALLEKLRVHHANLEAGASLVAEFDAAGVGSPRDGVFTRARALLGRLRAAEAVVDAARGHEAVSATDAWAKINLRLAAYDALKGGGE